MKTTFFPALLVAAMATCSMVPARALDRAVVVGVNKYPQLLAVDGAHPDLEGCINDAKAMGAALTKHGFAVTLLTDAKKAEIVSALRTTAQASREGDRFVFYFAGHGTQGTNRGARLLPNDARENGEANDLGADELRGLVANIKAKTRSILLDSCFSGGMSRNLSSPLRPTRKLRYYQRSVDSQGKLTALGKTRGVTMRGGKDVVFPASKDLILQAVSPNGADDTTHLNGEKLTSATENGTPLTAPDVAPICYFTASRANERAAEDEFNNQRRGVFSYFLAETLQVAAGQQARWGEVQAKVSAKVTEYMDSGQNPTITPAFIANPLFDVTQTAAPDKKPGLKPDDLWEIYSGDHVDRSKIQLEMRPNVSFIPVNSRISFQATVKDAGYLVIIEQGTSGKLNLLWPASANVDAAYHKGNAPLRVPSEGWSFVADATGQERIRAVLFSSRSLAEKLIAVFQTEKSRSLELPQATARMRDLKLVADEPEVAKPFYTADITFAVVPENRAGDIVNNSPAAP